MVPTDATPVDETLGTLRLAEVPIIRTKLHRPPVSDQFVCLALRHAEDSVAFLESLHGGLGKSFKGGTLSVGGAYRAQWKVIGDDPGQTLLDVFDEYFGKHRGFGIGPENTIPIATKKPICFINARFLWETGIRSQLEGTSYFLAASFPFPNISLQWDGVGYGPCDRFFGVSWPSPRRPLRQRYARQR